MSKKNTISRTYQVRLDATGPVDLISNTYDVYNRGAAFFFSFVTRLLGGYVADGTKQSAIESVPFWFTLQHDNGTDHEFAVSAHKIPVLHRHYWESQTSSNLPEIPELKCFYETIGSQRKGSIWIDQRRRFQEGNYKVDSETISLFVETVKSKANKNQFTRQCISRWWGLGDKSNWSEIAQIYSNLAKFANQHTTISADQFRHDVCELLGIDLCSPEEFNAKCHKAMGSKKGKSDIVQTLTRRLYEETNIISEDALDIYKTQVTRSAQAALKESKNSAQSWWTELQKDFETAVGMKFCGKDRCYTDEACEMMALGIQRYASWRTWFMKQMEERVTRRAIFDQARNEFSANSLLVDAIESVRRDDQQFLSTAQFRGIGKFLDLYKAGKSPDELRSYCEEANRHGNLGDSLMFSKIIEVLEKHKIDPVETANSIDQFIKLQDTASSYYMLRSNCLRLIDNESSVDPWFGKSKGHFSYVMADKPVVKGFDLTLGLFNGSDFVKTTVKVNGKRFCNEIYDAQGVNGSRDRSLVRKHANISTDELVSMFSKENEEKMSCQIKPINGKWFFNIKLELHPLALTKKELAAEYLNQGTSLFSVDLGWRSAAAFCHFVTDPNGDVIVQSEKRKTDIVRMRVEKMGIIKEIQTYKNGEKHYCRLEGRKRNAFPFEIDLRERLANMLGYKKPANADHLSVNDDIAFFAMKLARSKAENADKIVQDVFTHFQMARVGGLSVRKIKMLMYLRDAYNAVIKNIELKQLPVDPKLHKQREQIVHKMNNVRKERARITASCIVKYALETRSPLVVLEKLSPHGSLGNSRDMNNRISNWCASRIAQLVEQAGEEYGFVVKHIYPAYTSLTDFVTESLKTRFQVFDVNNLEKPYVIKELKKLLVNGSSNRERIVSACLRAKIETHNLDLNFDNLVKMLRKEAVDGKVYLPQVGGPMFHSDTMGWINSDMTAAAFIGKKGLKFFLGWSREREDAETTGVSVPSSKAKQGKYKPKPLDNEALSRGAKSLASVTWGVKAKSNTVVED